MLRHNLLLGLALTFAVSGIQAQDPFFTQSLSSYTQLNPTFTGKDSSNVLHFNHRNQWPNIQGSYLTSAVGYYHYLKATNGHLGATVLRDDAGAGTTVNSNFSLVYSQNFKIKSLVVRAGVKATYAQSALDYSKLTFGDQIDSAFGFITQNSIAGNVSVTTFGTYALGTSAFYKGFALGLSAYHIIGLPI